MSEKNKRAKRWKEAQESEFKFYSHIKKEEKFSKDFSYSPNALNYKFERWGIRDFDGNTILEVGCNVFGPLHYIRGKGTFKVGIDPLLGTLYEEVAAKDIFYIRGVGENLPFGDEEFDVVLCHNVLDHVNNPRKAVEEIHRVLKPRGAFLLCVNTHPNIIRMFSPVLNSLDKEHPYHLGSGQIQNIVRSHRFNINKFVTVKGFDTSEPKYGLLKRLLKSFKLKPFFAFFLISTLYITATKSKE
ncbi:MAG TPA: class I SAM-dependent methyltransferase [Candidatus Bathyarchaeia archaeon]|nr:class I SAM-dependent methyltransferase [Candidatus Bathyarchaeia archaeon]